VIQNFTIIIIILTAVVGLLAAADKFKFPNPVLLVVAGLGIGFIPSMPAIVLDPEVVFLIFLPPILYDAASNTSWHDFKSEIKAISTLAIALVIFTTGAVAAASYILIPGFSWPLAFVLGAIVSPPDAVAATNITKGLGLDKKVITILEGESLVNDASALIAYRFAVTAIGTGSFVFWQAGLNFFLVVMGGIFIGVVIGYVFVTLHKRILNNSIISTSLSLLTPFVSYLAAERIHVSGVLSIVSAGLFISWRAPDVFSYQTRIRHRAVWDTIVFLLNGFVFILIGLQLRSIVADLGQYSLKELIRYGLIISIVTILVRILWVVGAAFLATGNPREYKKQHVRLDNNTWKNVVVVAWTGTRGVVSLATALALPLTINGSSFPLRSLILFLAFVVIFVTLVIQGLSLPLLLKLLKIKQQDNSDYEERELRLSIANSVLNYIDQELSDKISELTRNQIRKQYIELIEALSKTRNAAHADSKDIAGELSPMHELLKAQLEINKFERKLLIGYHKAGTFNHSTIRRLEQKLDLEELLSLNRAKKKKH
jgi:CPA1 family monovalent cation:H+ antiporter